VLEERRSPERRAPLLDSEPELVIQFRDPVTRSTGLAVIDTLATGCAYAAVRIQPGVRWTDLAPLARIATVRYQLARVALGGARVALDYDPHASDVDEVLGRFLLALGPQLSLSLGLGPDKHVSATRLDTVLRRNRLPWRMAAVQRSQGWPLARWQNYQHVLEQSIDNVLIRDRQIVYSVAQAALTAASIVLQRSPTVCIIGSGDYGGRIANEITNLGANVVGFGNAAMGGYAPSGLPRAIFSLTDTDPSFDQTLHAVTYITQDELCALPVDVLILANAGDAVTVDNVGLLRTHMVVEATPNAITRSAERVLLARNVPVLPAFASTMGGVLLADGILRGEIVTAEEAAEFVTMNVRATIEQLVRLSATLNIPLREGGVRLAFHRWSTPPPGTMTPTAPIEFVESLDASEVID
jgi:glutamate dehydrogenase/leucine dehydrogenase